MENAQNVTAIIQCHLIHTIHKFKALSVILKLSSRPKVTLSWSQLIIKLHKWNIRVFL